LIDTDGKNQKKLTETAIEPYPSWCPDGIKIAFASRQDGSQEIYVIDADGKNQKKLTKDLGVATSPAWCPSFLPEITALFATLKEKDKK
jgi:TolB protein